MWLFTGCSHIVEVKWSKTASSGKPGSTHASQGDDRVSKTDRLGKKSSFPPSSIDQSSHVASAA